jgi:hypothetical protein
MNVKKAEAAPQEQLLLFMPRFGQTHLYSIFVLLKKQDL